MADDALDARRLALALRLKAARYMAGHRVPNRKGDGHRAVAITASALANHPGLQANGVTKNRIEDIEQMTVDARPWELRELTLALAVPPTWFDVAGLSPSDRELLDEAGHLAEQNGATATNDAPTGQRSP